MWTGGRLAGEPSRCPPDTTQGEIMNRIQRVFIVGLTIALAACASSHVLIGEVREPLEDWEQVKVYLEPPPKYETVALLEASDMGAVALTAQSKMNKVMSRLRAEAADLGANGILLQGFDTQYVGSFGNGYAQTSVSGNTAYTTGTGFSSAMSSKVGKAIAIYVPEE